MYVRRKRGRGFGLGGIVQDLASAITRQENVNPSYNNPGALIAAPGCTSRSGAIAICPDAATGQAALERQIQLYIDRGYNLQDMMAKWAPVCNDPLCAGNDPAKYAQNVSTWTGIDPTVPLNSLASSPDAASPGAFSSSVASSDFFSPSDTGGFDLSSISPVTVGIGLGILALAVWMTR